MLQFICFFTDKKYLKKKNDISIPSILYFFFFVLLYLYHY